MQCWTSFLRPSTLAQNNSTKKTNLFQHCMLGEGGGEKQQRLYTWVSRINSVHVTTSMVVSGSKMFAIRRISYPESMSMGSVHLSKPIANIKHWSLGGVSVSFPISNVTVREVEYSNDCNLDSKTWETHKMQMVRGTRPSLSQTGAGSL